MDRARAPRSSADVRDLTTGRRSSQRRGDIARIPASVEKLYTTATRCCACGPSARSTTRVLAPASVDATAARGDLDLVGGGDPTLDRAAIARLARAVHRAGIRRVERLGARRRVALRRAPRRAAHRRPLRPRHGRRARRADRRPRLLGAARRPGAGRGARAGSGAARRGRARLGRTARRHRARRRARRRALALAADERARAPHEPARRTTSSPRCCSRALGAHVGGAGTTARRRAPSCARSSASSACARDRRRLRASRAPTARRRATSCGLLERDARRLGRGAAFEASLAVAGRSGTLRRRMRGTAAARRCRGKTGTLIGVSALAGLLRRRARATCSAFALPDERRDDLARPPGPGPRRCARSSPTARRLDRRPTLGAARRR